MVSPHALDVPQEIFLTLGILCGLIFVLLFSAHFLLPVPKPRKERPMRVLPPVSNDGIKVSFDQQTAAQLTMLADRPHAWGNEHPGVAMMTVDEVVVELVKAQLEHMKSVTVVRMGT